jgi:uncharacterized membrane protein (Fun14 family)
MFGLGLLIGMILGYVLKSAAQDVDNNDKHGG